MEFFEVKQAPIVVEEIWREKGKAEVSGGI